MSMWILKEVGLGNERIYKGSDLGGGWVYEGGGGKGEWGYMRETVEEVDGGI